MTNERTMYYGKKDVFVYRTYAKPLIAETIPESNFTKRENIIFGVDVQVALHGDFLHNYIDGDNSNLVATDSMNAKLVNSSILQLTAFLRKWQNGLLPSIHKLTKLR